MWFQWSSGLCGRTGPGPSSLSAHPLGLEALGTCSSGPLPVRLEGEQSRRSRGPRPASISIPRWRAISATPTRRLGDQALHKTGSSIPGLVAPEAIVAPGTARGNPRARRSRRRSGRPCASRRTPRRGGRGASRSPAPGPRESRSAEPLVRVVGLEDRPPRLVESSARRSEVNMAPVRRIRASGFRTDAARCSSPDDPVLPCGAGPDTFPRRVQAWLIGHPLRDRLDLSIILEVRSESTGLGGPGLGPGAWSSTRASSFRYPSAIHHDLISTIDPSRLLEREFSPRKGE